MDDFALNGAAINGEANEWVTLEGTAEIAFDCILDGIRGAGMVANETINFDTSGNIYAGLIGTGSVDVELDAALQPSLLTKITGDIPISLDAQMAASLRKAIAGSLDIELDVGLNVIRWAMGTGTVMIDFGLTGEGRIVQRVQIEGVCGIVLDPMLLDGRRTPAHRPEMPLLVDVKLEGPAWLRMQAQGNALINTVMEGVGRIGGKVRLEGATEFELITDGDLRRYALVPVEGVADVQFLLISELAGRPSIPADYVPAPTSRRFVVARERRERVLIYDRSL